MANHPRHLSLHESEGGVVKLPSGAEGVDVWLIVLDGADPTLLDRWRGCLSEDELRRLDRITHPGSRRLFLAGRGLLRMTLSLSAGADPRGLVFGYNAHGKPALKSPAGTGLSFSISHSRGLAMCAVGTDCTLGVDVERGRRGLNSLEIARRFFAPAEAAMLECLPAERRDAAFIGLWTLREAFVKARGVGLLTRPAEFAFSLSGDADASVAFGESYEGRRDGWRFYRFRPENGYRAALAVAPPDVD